ncbi:MAG: penicillin-binding protein activator LpoB [Treponema sp.]|nr:penicillin-binding protein activator LpoB [Treponema sp.]
MKQTIFCMIAAVMLITACAGTPKASAANAAADAEFAAFEAVIDKSFNNLEPRLTAENRIALLPLNAADKENGDYAYDTLTVMFTNSGKYDMVERAQINQIIQEQNFQLSGMVSDETAVSIGKFLGAQVMIIGDISGSGNTRRLVFRALDVETGKILGISSERF